MNRSSRADILHGVERLRRRSTLVTFAGLGLRALFYTLLVGALVLLLVPAASPWVVALGAAAVAGLFAFGASILSEPSTVAVAKVFDDHAGLKDRVSSSVDLMDEQDPMVELLLADTAERTKAIEPAAAFPMRVPREGYLLPVPLLAGLLILVLPGLFSTTAQANPELEATLADQAAQIERFVAKERAEKPTPRKKELLAQLERIQKELTRDDLDKKDAMAEIAKLMEEFEKEKEAEEEKKLKLEELIKSFQKNDLMRELADELNEGEYEEVAAKLKEMIDELKEELERKKAEGLDPEELEELERQLEELEEMLAELQNLQMMQSDMQMMDEVLEFLGQCEGELACLGDKEAEDAKFVRIGQCKAPGECDGKLLRIDQRLITQPSTKAGVGTMADFFGEERRTDATLEEHKIKVREGEGRSSYTQTQVANDGSKSKLGEREVYMSERRAAEDTIERQDVPAGYREYVRRYFEGIQPETSEDDR